MIFDIPAHYHRDATIAVVSQVGRDTIVHVTDSSAAVSGIPRLASGEDWTLVFDFYATSDYFHFMEGLIWVYIIQHCCFQGQTMRRIVLTSQYWDNPQQGRPQSALLNLLYPGVEIVDHGGGQEYEARNLVYLDRTLSKTNINKFLDQALPFGRPYVMRMCDQVRTSVGATHSVRNTVARPKVLYVKCPLPSSLAPSPERGLLALLARSFDVNVVELGALPWLEQVRAVAVCDILVGVHGKVLTNLLWLAPGSVVIDIMPAGFRQYDYQLLCELCGISYFGLEGDLVHRDHGRDGPCRGTGAEGSATLSRLSWPAINDILAAISSIFGIYA